MTYAGTQQVQYRPNRSALWVNERKTSPSHPDYKGNLEISWALLQELQAAFTAGHYVMDGGGQPCIKLDLALYAQQGGVSNSGRAKPILTGRLSTFAETQQSLAMRQQAAAGYQQAAPAPAPLAPMAAPAQMAAPPAPVAPMPGAIHAQPLSPVAPAGF